jgi:tetratricopeptide (TPR) repeat protein
MPGVFISYRRADSIAWAGRLEGDLSMRFGKDLVFQDFDDISPGEDFYQAIHKFIEHCDVMLVLIGSHWLKDSEGLRRLDDPEDVLCKEVTDALGRNKTVIPVLLGGASMPSADDLPDQIKSLSKRQAVEISDTRWNYDVAQLIKRLQELIIPGGDKLSLVRSQQHMHQEQLRYFDLLDNNDGEALELADKAMTYLDRVCPVYPDDPYLQLVRGFFHKNRAMALRNLARREEFEKALNDAERVFDTMIRLRPKDPDAWNGKGNVEALRGNLQSALQFTDRALEIDPDNESAQRDREVILRQL